MTPQPIVKACQRQLTAKGIYLALLHRIGTVTPYRDYNNAPIFQICKSHFCPEKTKWQTTTLGRPSKDQ